MCPTDEVHAEIIFWFDSFNGRCCCRPTGPQQRSASCVCVCVRACVRACARARALQYVPL